LKAVPTQLIDGICVPVCDKAFIRTLIHSGYAVRDYVVVHKEKLFSFLRPNLQNNLVNITDIVSLPEINARRAKAASVGTSA
jgi:hypothetical protein